MHEHSSRQRPFQPELQTSPLLRILIDRTSTITFFLLVGAVLIGSFFTLARLFPSERTAGIGIICLLLTLAWVDRVLDMRSKAQPWGRLAAVTGLRCRVSGLLGGYRVYVDGEYRGHALALYTSPTGKGLIQSTELGARIFADTEQRTTLAGLPTLVTIELRIGSLRFEQIGVVRDGAYLLHIFDLLCDLAELLEEEG